MNYKTSTPFLYLASQSRRRKALLKGLLLFKVVPSSYQESPLPRNWPPSKIAKHHALKKAQYAKIPTRALPISEKRVFVLGADTIVYFQGKVLGKPRTFQEAEKMLLALNGKSHWVYTGLALLHIPTKKALVDYSKTRVQFKKWTKTQIRNYIQRINPLDKAGAYAIQRRPYIVEYWEGSYTNVIGLPLELLYAMLEKMDAFSGLKNDKDTENGNSPPRRPQRHSKTA